MNERLDRFVRRAVERALTDTGFTYRTDDDGDYIVEFEYDQIADCILDFAFVVTTQKISTLDLLCHSDKDFTTKNLHALINLCNQWNSMRRWPKAYVIQKNNSVDKEVYGKIVLENSLSIQDEVNYAIILRAIQVFAKTSFEFWEWFKEQWPEKERQNHSVTADSIPTP